MKYLVTKLEDLAAGQLWVLSIAIVLASGSLFLAERSWESRFTSSLEANSRLREIGEDSCRPPACDVKEMTTAIIKSGISDIVALNQFYKLKAWLRPAANLLLFFVTPVAILLIHWQWHAAKSRNAADSSVL